MHPIKKLIISFLGLMTLTLFFIMFKVGYDQPLESWREPFFAAAGLLSLYQFIRHLRVKDTWRAYGQGMMICIFWLPIGVSRGLIGSWAYLAACLFGLSGLLLTWRTNRSAPFTSFESPEK